MGDDAVLVPMDGFHLAQEELVRQGSRDRMGAPDTFDVGGFASLLTRLRRQDEEVVYAPDFDRSIEKPIAGSIAIPRRVPLVVTEGNYLLHDDDGWRVIAPLLDTTWYVEAPRALRTERLVARRIAHGDDPAHSEQWVRTVDARNARTVERTRALADVVLERGKGATSIALTASSLPAWTSPSPSPTTTAGPGTARSSTSASAASTAPTSPSTSTASAGAGTCAGGSSGSASLSTTGPCATRSRRRTTSTPWSRSSPTGASTPA